MSEVGETPRPTETVIDRGIVTTVDEYKVVVVCALSNATFDDLEWPRTPVSRSQYSLKANILETVHQIYYIFGSIGEGFRGRRIEWRYFRLAK